MEVWDTKKDSTYLREGQLISTQVIGQAIDQLISTQVIDRQVTSQISPGVAQLPAGRRPQPVVPAFRADGPPDSAPLHLHHRAPPTQTH